MIILMCIQAVCVLYLRCGDTLLQAIQKGD